MEILAPSLSFSYITETSLLKKFLYFAFLSSEHNLVIISSKRQNNFSYIVK